MTFKVGDIVRGVSGDVEGLILEVISAGESGYFLKTLENSKSKFRHRDNFEYMEELQIGGVFKRETFWEGCLKLHNIKINWREVLKK